MAIKQHTLERFFSGSTDDKLLEMEHLFVDHGGLLLANKDVQESLSLISRHMGELARHMEGMDLGMLCSSCAATETGGCCSGYMEANTDVILLLMNRLRGSSVKRLRPPSEGCCFLGETGCTLPIKPMFCLNYNCSHIRKRASDAEMASLEMLAGRLLTEQTKLETIILQNL